MKMKKITSFLFLFIVSVVAQGQMSRTEEITDSSGKILGHVQILQSDGKYYWGCHDSVIMWRPDQKLFKIKNENGEFLTVIPLTLKVQQTVLTYALTQYMRNDHLSEREAFKKIFIFYKEYESIYPDWTIIILDEPPPKK